MNSRTGLLLLFATGCGSAMERNSNAPIEAAAAVPFDLGPEQMIPISISLPWSATVNVLIKDESNANAVAVTQIGFPSGDYLYLYGLCSGSYCPSLAMGSATKLPTGSYTAEVATDDSALPLRCSFTPAAATHAITLQGNLNETATPPHFDSLNPRTTSNFTSSMTVYDFIGTARQLDLYFGKSSPAETQPGDSGDWTYHVLTDGANLTTEGDGKTASTPGKSTEVAMGSFRFGSRGELISNVPSTELVFHPQGAIYPQKLDFHFGTGTADGGNGLDGFTQYAATSCVTFVTRDGTGPFIHCDSPAGATDAGRPIASTQNSFAGQPAATTNVIIQIREPAPAETSLGIGEQPPIACVCEEKTNRGDNDVQAIVSPPGVSPHLTQSIALAGNLDQIVAPSAPFDPTKANATSNFSTAVTVYDSLGDAIDLIVYFSKNDALNTQGEDSGDWAYHVVADGRNLAAAADGVSVVEAGAPTVIAAGQLRFDFSGRLLSNVTTLNGFYPKGAMSPQVMAFDFGTALDSGGSGLDGISQYSATSDIWSGGAISKYPEPCTLDLSGEKASAFRCWQVSWAW